MRMLILMMIMALFACKQEKETALADVPVLVEQNMAEDQSTILEDEIKHPEHSEQPETKPEETLEKPIINQAEQDIEEQVTANHNDSKHESEPVKEVVDESVFQNQDELPVSDEMVVVEEMVEQIEQIEKEVDSPAGSVDIAEDIKELLPLKQVPDHQLFDAILQKFVSADGVVDYKGLKANQAKLEIYIKELQTKALKENWSRNEKLAYWINAYNAFTLKLILDHFPVNSILDINNGKAWDLKWIELGGKTISLNQIENDIIRPKFNEPSIHFAVNCAAKSCPPLYNRAFTASNLDGFLHKQTKAFINNPKYTKIKGQQFEISKIFEWYAVDFGDIKNYIAKYYDGDLPNKTPIYYEYDWSLNGKQ